MAKKIKKKWFKEIKKSVWGFQKSKTIKANINKMVKLAKGKAKKMMPKHLLRAARHAQALANVTKDKATKSKARKVAKQLLKKYHKRKGNPCPK